MNILLIGGTGILSSAVTAEAMRLGFNVTMINRGKRKLPRGAEVIVSNNKDYDHIRKVLAGRHFDAIIDFLCYTVQDLTDSFKLYSNLTDQYFFVSSCSVYDTTHPGIYTEESAKVTRVWPYSVEKWKGECMLRQLASTAACKYTIIRPCLTYGDTRLPYGITPQFRMHWTFVARILSGKPILRWSGGENRWNMMRVEDFAVGLVGLIGNPKAYGEAFNICGDETPSNNDVLKAISKAIEVEAKTVDLTPEFCAEEFPWLTGEILGGRAANLVCSNAKIKSVVPAFRQAISLEEGVKRTIQAYRDDAYQLGIDWAFDAICDRAIARWNRIHGLGRADALKFIDYIHNATLRDRFTYMQSRHRGKWWMRLIVFSIRVAGFIHRKVKGK